MQTVNEWMRGTTARPREITRIDSSVARLCAAITMRERAASMGAHLEAEYLIRMLGQKARVRVLQRALNETLT